VKHELAVVKVKDWIAMISIRGIVVSRRKPNPDVTVISEYLAVETETLEASG
jgi:hypothetical protein